MGNVELVSRGIRESVAGMEGPAELPVAGSRFGRGNRGFGCEDLGIGDHKA